MARTSVIYHLLFMRKISAAGISDVILSTYDSEGGDSGGLVFYDNGEAEVHIVGIHKGRYTSTDKAVACKATNILSALNINLWY